jgi:L-malate glycosyltransferase
MLLFVFLAPMREDTMSKRIRILFVETYTHVAGGQKGLLELVEHLDKNVFEPFVLIQGTGNLSKGLADRGIPFIVKRLEPFKNRWLPFSWLLGVRPVSQAIRELKPDIVHSNHLYVGRYSGRAAQAMGIPSVVTLRVVHAPEIFNKYNVEHTLQCHSQIVSNSYAGANVFGYLTHLQHKLTTIQNGMNLDRFKPVDTIQELKIKYTQSLGIPSDSIIITQIASVVRQKGNEVLTQAFASLCATHPNIHLVFVGGPFNRAYNGDVLKKMAQDYGITERIHFTDFVWNVTEFLNITDICVLASIRHEGLPRCLIEALACGKPAIGTNVGGVSEIIDDGVNGFVVPPNNVEALANALNTLLCDKAMRLSFGQAGLQKAQEYFDIKVMIQKYQAIYTRLVQHKPNHNNDQ